MKRNQKSLTSHQQPRQKTNASSLASQNETTGDNSGRTTSEQGFFPKELDKPYIDKEESLKWLKKGRLGFDNEKIILAAQDQGLMTKGFMKMAGLTQDDQ